MAKKAMPNQNTKLVDELSEDMEVVGPGQMLSDARTKLSLSVEDVAEKLKFKITLVENIEHDVFDQSLPATYNRGYLRSYAKLVNVDADEVLSAYDMLGVAEVQRSEMQSFSNLTEKQAEHSRIMWFSYFIVALLLGLMVLWWFQEPALLVDENSHPKADSISTQNVSGEQAEEQQLTKLSTLDNSAVESIPPASLQQNGIIDEPNAAQATNKTADKISAEQTLNNAIREESKELTVKAAVTKEEQASDTVLSTAVFTFSGDCWVNIYDATGERIAWGVKKSGYVMTITGKAPLKVTLGKPELAAIVFNGEAVDMSPFNVGNIAKFTLPLTL